jgi:multisite-specific tRNA:(cytosine-C5)-methyltransferase
VQDGLSMMLPYITKQVIHPTLAELKLILTRRSLQLESDPERPDRALFLNEETMKEVRASAAGSCVFLPRVETAADRAMLAASVSTPEAGPLDT